jgi:sporulation protein YlmC with PRC-barrel domain
VAETTQDEREPGTAHGEPEPKEMSADDLLGQQVVDPHGATIGKVEALFIHGHDERASWARVRMDLIRTSSAFLPLHDAQKDRGRIRVVYERERVKKAPEITPEGSELSDEEADQLRGHYGLERVTGLAVEGDDIELPRETRDANPPTMQERPWAVEKYPLPDMGREGERSQQAESSGQDSEARPDG